ncbi:hypothetical protein CONLIGDRAFT_587493, partial [Coniochaeta ligniaria NRRL 30616]
GSLVSLILLILYIASLFFFSFLAYNFGYINDVAISYISYILEETIIVFEIVVIEIIK